MIIASFLVVLITTLISWLIEELTLAADRSVPSRLPTTTSLITAVAMWRVQGARWILTIRASAIGEQRWRPLRVVLARSAHELLLFARFILFGANSISAPSRCPLNAVWFHWALLGVV